MFIRRSCVLISNVPFAFQSSLLSIAARHVDEHRQRHGLPVELLESTNFRLPLTLPNDGYTCETLQGIPQQLLEFIEPINRSYSCRLFAHPFSLGYWTEFLVISHVDIPTTYIVR
jgi:hypothetical protein